MDDILDFNKELDVGLVDRVVTTAFTGSGAEQQMAMQVLTQFQEHPDSWMRADQIMDSSSSIQSKYIALQIIEKLVQTRWKILPREQAEGIKTYIVSCIIKISSDEQTMIKEKTFLSKLNLVLVQILKHEWPEHWPTFITEIVSSSKTNFSLCENNMVILRLLSEEVFEFSADQMTQAKTKNLKSQMCGEFSDIFQLCLEVLEKAQKPSLIKATLKTLLKFLNWIPLGYIFETSIIEVLRTRFLEVPLFRNDTLRCMTEIGSLTTGQEYNDKFVILFDVVMGAISSMIPIATDFAEVYEKSPDEDQKFIQNLALFFTTFLGKHLQLIENHLPNQETLRNAHWYLLNISKVDDRETLKICLEYWYMFVKDLYEEITRLPVIEVPLLSISAGGGAAPPEILANFPLRKHKYQDILSALRLVMIDSMVKPEEVLIVENDEGEIVRETLKDSDTIMLYKSMRETLVLLTHLDVTDTENIMIEKLQRQVDGTEWSWNRLNKLCWAIGSISGAMDVETEKRFLVTVIKDLLSLCEMKRGKDNKAVVAANIMYTVGQYPRFLKDHWKFLKTVVNKLFEFMHETHEGVQDMACETFVKIAQKCRRCFITQQKDEMRPHVEEIIDNMEETQADLSPAQVNVFYEAIGYMISAQQNRQSQERLIERFMALPNSSWRRMMDQAASSVDVLNNNDNIKVLGNILKTNVAACGSIGAGFFSQLGFLYGDMLGLYKAVSSIISDTVSKQGPIATKTPRIRGLRTIKKEILKLVETYMTKADDLNAVNNVLIPNLLDAVLGDYMQNADSARDSEVLSVMCTIVTQLGPLITPQIPLILEGVFECTLQMINKDFTEYPEHRLVFYKLLRAINQQCFPALLELPAPQFKLVMDSIVWGFKHTMRDIADLGLTIILELLENITRTDASIANGFYQTYFLSILQDVFFVLTDTDHKSGFHYQCCVLAKMFYIVETGAVQAPLFTTEQVNDPAMTNQQFLREYVMNLLQNAFPHLTRAQIQVFVLGLFELNTDFAKFKLHLRDFLIQLKQFSDDNTDLFLEEREAEIALAQKQEREAAMKIPGMIPPLKLPNLDEEND